MSGQSGKGNSSAQTTQQVANNQVATESGIALGAGAKGNSINVSTSDPETVKAALTANAYVTNDSLGFAGHAADVAAQTSIFAQKTVEDIAGGSILANNDLASKFSRNISDLAAQNVGLLSSVANNLTDVSLGAQDSNNKALDLAFGVAAQAAPQTDNYTATALAATSSKTFMYIAIAIAAVFGFFFLARKKA